MTEPLDPTKWPKWLHHVSLESVMVTTPDEEAALPGGYRALPYSEAEKAEHARAEAEAATTAHKREVARLTQTLSEPVEDEEEEDAPPPRVQAKKAAPKKKRERWTPSGRTGRR